MKAAAIDQVTYPSGRSFENNPLWGDLYEKRSCLSSAKAEEKTEEKCY